MTKTALFLFFFSLIPFSFAMAIESLRFQAPVSYKEKQAITLVKKLHTTPRITYHIATTDLNNDAIDEYIIKPASARDCQKKPLCQHSIIALQDHAPLLIGQFDAHKILISDKKTYGVRHIIVYNQPHNDFKTATAIWSPFNFRFELP